MHFAHDLIAGFALGTRGGPTGVWRGGGTLDAHAAWGRRLLPALEVVPHDLFGRPTGAPRYDLVALRAIAGGTAYHGTLIPNRTLGVWIALRRSASPAWAGRCCQSLARQVGM